MNIEIEKLDHGYLVTMNGERMAIPDEAGLRELLDRNLTDLAMVKIKDAGLSVALSFEAERDPVRKVEG